MQRAKSGVRKGLYGAGDVLWSKRQDVADLAIVLEPEIPFENAVQMIPLTMVACGDCLGVVTPPQVGVSFHWPNAIKVNDGLVGHVRGISSTQTPGAVPDWLILGLSVRLRHNRKNFEPGDDPAITALSEEGCEDLTRSQFIESFTRHFLTWINQWNDDGFKPVHAAWLFRAGEMNEEAIIETGENNIEGAFLGLDENGNLLAKNREGKSYNRYLSEVFEGSEAMERYR